jgi:5-methylcytosine-specific restriction protein A
MADRIYSKQQWKRLRKVKLSLDPLCAHCLLVGLAEPAREVHHKQAINNGGEPWDLDNLVCLCTPCHSRATRSEQEGKQHIVKGVDPLTGKPVDPSHPFNEEKSLRADELVTATEDKFRVS